MSRLRSRHLPVSPADRGEGANTSPRNRRFSCLLQGVDRLAHSNAAGRGIADTTYLRTSGMRQGLERLPAIEAGNRVWLAAVS